MNDAQAPDALRSIISKIKYTQPINTESKATTGESGSISIDTASTVLSWMDLSASVFAYCELNHCHDRAPAIIQRAQSLTDGVIAELGIAGVSPSIRFSIVRSILKVPILADEVLAGVSERETIKMLSAALSYSLDIIKGMRHEGAWIGSIDKDGMETNRAVLLLERMSSIMTISNILKDKIDHMEDGLIESFRAVARIKGLDNEDTFVKERVEQILGTLKKNGMEKVAFMTTDFADIIAIKTMILSMSLTEKIIKSIDGDILDESSEMVFQSCLKSVTAMLVAAAPSLSIFRSIEHIRKPAGNADYVRGEGLFVPLLFDSIQSGINAFTSGLGQEPISVRQVIYSPVSQDVQKSVVHGESGMNA